MMTILREDDPRMVPVVDQRAHVTSLKAEIRSTTDAPWPRAYRDELLRTELKRIENASADGANRWAKVLHPLHTAAAFPDASWATLLDLFGVDGVQKLISDRLDRLGLPEGLAPSARALQLRTIEKRLFDAEVEEELVICTIEAEHRLHVLRRHDVDPAAVIAAWQKAAA